MSIGVTLLTSGVILSVLVVQLKSKVSLLLFTSLLLLWSQASILVGQVMINQSSNSASVNLIREFETFLFTGVNKLPLILGVETLKKALIKGRQGVILFLVVFKGSLGSAHCEHSSHGVCSPHVCHSVLHAEVMIFRDVRTGIYNFLSLHQEKSTLLLLELSSEVDFDLSLSLEEFDEVHGIVVSR
jgi:hypothetical protein